MSKNKDTEAKANLTVIKSLIDAIATVKIVRFSDDDIKVSEIFTAQEEIIIKNKIFEVIGRL